MGKSRNKKYNDFLRLFNPDDKNTTILDVGVADREYSPYDNYLEKNYSRQYQITALSLQKLNEFPDRYPEIKVVTYPGGRFPFSDNQFSIVHSNAVIEHVGNTNRQVDFINEMARCGKRFFFTTPAKEFPIEIHTNYPFIHWLSDSHFNYIISKLGKGWAANGYMNLLTYKKLHTLMEESTVSDYKILTYKIGTFPFQYIVWGQL